MPPVNIALFDPDTENIPSTSSCKKRQTKLKITKEPVAMDHDGFEDFGTTPHEHLIKKTLHVSITTSASPDKKRKIVLVKKRCLVKENLRQLLQKEINWIGHKNLPLLPFLHW